MLNSLTLYFWPDDPEQVKHVKIIQKWWRICKECRDREDAANAIQYWWRIEMWWRNKKITPKKQVNKKKGRTLRKRIFRKRSDPEKFVMNLYEK